MGRRGWDGGKHRSPGIPPFPPYQIPQAPKRYFVSSSTLLRRGMTMITDSMVFFVKPFITKAKCVIRSSLVSVYWRLTAALIQEKSLLNVTYVKSRVHQVYRNTTGSTLWLRNSSCCVPSVTSLPPAPVPWRHTRGHTLARHHTPALNVQSPSLCQGV